MLKRSKRLVGLATIAVAAVGIAACGGGGGDQEPSKPKVSKGFATCLQDPNGCNTAPTKPGGTMVYALEQDVSVWHVISADGGHFATSQMMNPIVPTPFVALPDYTMGLNTDLLVSAEQTSTSPQTIVYKIRPEAVWSDGTPISAQDFLYNLWTFDGKTCGECTPGSTSGYELVDTAVASDNDKTLTLTFGTPFPDWKGLFTLYPAHIAKQNGWNGTKEDAAGMAKSFKAFETTQPTWSGGPFKIQSYEKGVALTEVPNEKWYGKTKPALEKLVFRIIEEQAALVPALRNGEINAIYPQPNQQLVNDIASLQNVNYLVAPGLSFEHFDLNTSNKYLADQALRKAIFTAVDREDIIKKTVGLFAKDTKPLNNHIYMPGSKFYQDQVTATGMGQGKLDEAKKILTDAGYKDVGTALKTPSGEAIPPLRFRHTVGNQLRANTAQIFQNTVKQLGITVNIQTTDALSATLNSGDFDVIIFAWVTSPLVGTTAKDLWATKSPQNYAKHSNAEYDKIAEEAAVSTDEAKLAELNNQAVKILTEDAVVLPLFQRANMIAVSSDFVNIRNNGTSTGPTYNTQEWGTAAS